ncbi:PilN domain-containing protein [Photobacterium lipolyticum]|uniref:Pilus assembly protein PilS n=1 Tax=Photobacterium lipolyticum TaxID=266810 RepID=A0A2T3MY26_9GAMM|nr:PilN domain-containing protein [Photobacterium lipolyticum]PSW04867.1 pilus assembly protein PilS [Photobacterium lipolyticum]
MIDKLNLLPWREEKRKKHKQRFVGMLVIAVASVVAVHWLSASYIVEQKSLQQSRNQQLQQEIAVLERRRAFLPELDKQRDALNKRLQVIVDIQQERNRVTQLFSLLPALVPPGVYLENLTLKAGNVSLNGVGESNGRLASLLSNAENSVWLENVAMHSIVATKGKNAEELTRFKASFNMVRTTDEEQAVAQE